MSAVRDPAERSALMRLFYRDWHPTRLGRWVNQVQGWVAGLGLPPHFQVLLEVRGRKSGRIRSQAVVMPTVEGRQYIVSMLGPDSEWVKNLGAAHGEASIRHGRRRKVHLTRVAPDKRGPIIREYVRIAGSGRRHFPVGPKAPLSAFNRIAARYPVYRVDP